MTWNYRVLQGTDGSLTIHEAYYDKEGALELISQDAIEPYGVNLAELEQDLKWMLAAITQPILTLADIKALEKDLEYFKKEAEKVESEADELLDSF